MHNTKNNYILGVGDVGAKRLQLLHRVYGPGTEALLSNIGLASGMRIADIGCGIGMASMWMARQVGSTGSVLCVDKSAEQLAVARRAAVEHGYENIACIEASADHVDLPSESVDVAYCRFLLDHLPDPQVAVSEMRRLLRPGGVLATETIDLTGMATDPPEMVYTDEIRHMKQVSELRGIDGASGLKIHRMFRAVGFHGIEVRFNQPVYFAGEEKRFWEYSVAESASAIVALGYSTLSEVERRIEEMQRVNMDESILVALPRCVQVWARK